MASHKAQAELPDWAGMARDEIAHMLGDRNAFNVAAGLYFEGDIF
jgi:hypothetical protein